MGVLIESHDVTVERVAGTTDVTGWTLDTGRVVMWTGRAQVSPAGASTGRLAASEGGSGPYSPQVGAQVVVLLPVDAICAPGDVITLDGQEYAVGHTMVRRGPVASLDHLRAEAVTV